MSCSDDLGRVRLRGGDGGPRRNTHTYKGGEGTFRGWKRKKQSNHDNDGDDGPYSPPHLGHHVISAALPSLLKFSMRLFLGTTVALYVLNQKHMLPKPLGSFVSRALFWPTLPITIANRIGKWSTVVDDTVILGGAPFGFANIPERLLEDYDVRGVINMCDEYRGPIEKYDELGMQELWLRTVDHFEPSVEDMKKAVSFIRYHRDSGNRVYVHCRAGHGRSAAVTFAWLMFNYPKAEPMELNRHLCQLRNVRKTLWKQPNVNRYRSWLKSTKEPFSSDDSWVPTKRLVNKDHIRSERKRRIKPIYDESESDIEGGNANYWQDVWGEESSMPTSIRTSSKRKLDKFWRQLFGFSDTHIVDSDSDMDSEEFSDSELNMEYFN